MSFSTTFTPFGWPIIIYLTLAGLACGATLCAISFMRSEDNAKPGQSTYIAKTALVLAILSIVVGTVFLAYDLGNSNRFYLNFLEFNPKSVIAWGTRIITIFIMLCVLALFLLNTEGPGKPIGPVLTGFLLLFALAIGIYPAFVLGQAAARPLWEPMLLAPLFLLLGIHTGLATMQLLTFDRWAEKTKEKIRKLDMGIIVLQIALFALLIVLTPISSAGKERLFFGEFALWFWLGVVLIGWALPFLTGLSRTNNKNLSLLSQLCFVFGALALRAVIVFGGQGAQSFISS